MIKRVYMWLTRQLVCKQAVALMTDYVDGRLSPRDATRLERHLSRCAVCSEYLAQLRVTVDALGHAAPLSLSPEAQDALVSLYRAWRNDAT